MIYFNKGTKTPKYIYFLMVVQIRGDGSILSILGLTKNQTKLIDFMKNESKSMLNKEQNQ